MKYPIPTAILLFSLVFGLIAHPIALYAQTSQSPAQPALFDVNAQAPLSTRKAYVETNLRDLLAQLTDFHARVRTASTRLDQNGINVDAATARLDLAQTALMTAKINLDLFALTPATNKPSTIATLRTQAKASEDALKNARTNLIESIAALKITLQTQ